MRIRLERLWRAGLFIVLATASTGVFSAEYIFRDLMANTVPSAKCVAKDEAGAKASDPYTVQKQTRQFCETQGYGWHVSAEKSPGKLVCDECTTAASQGMYQCHLEDVVVTCKRLKPGSVGMFPGKG